jgi:phosphate uptake regulator
MNELRKLQQQGHKTLTVSIPAEFAKEFDLQKGHGVLVKEEVDGTLRLIPVEKAKKVNKVTIKVDYVKDEKVIPKLIVGCYVLGYDTIEVTSKNGLKASVTSEIKSTIRRLRGLETVESNGDRIVVQSFMDPTKFPVDSLIKRLQLLVSESLSLSIGAFEGIEAAPLNEVSAFQDEIDELYWLIMRQLLVALTNREIAAEIGIESPLRASGDRVAAKTLEQIGSLIVDLTEEMARLNESGIYIGKKALKGIKELAENTRGAFNATVVGLLAPEIEAIEKATALVDETLQLEKRVTHELLSPSEYAYSRTIVSYLGQVARYCNIIIEVSLNRLLRKSSKVAVVQSQ